LYLQTIQKRALDESTRNDLIEKAIQENERLEKLIDNILNASRLENNALKPVKTKTNLSELVQQVADRIEKRHQKKFILRAIDEEVEASVDAFFIETIIVNLIENAVKYAGVDKDITLALKRGPAGITLEIRDHGPGISGSDRGNIFRKFYRSGNEETRTQKGSGLGLFIVAELVRIHSGKIVYKENSPNGAVFQITL
jgi:K+-sensing histidine kinase KdpD